MTTHLPGGLAGASESVIEEIQLRVPLEHYTAAAPRAHERGESKDETARRIARGVTGTTNR